MIVPILLGVMFFGWHGVKQIVLWRLETMHWIILKDGPDYYVNF